MSLAHAVAQLRHLYAQMVEERVKSPVHAAIGILGPAIEEIERFQMNLPGASSAAPRAADSLETFLGPDNIRRDPGMPTPTPNDPDPWNVRGFHVRQAAREFLRDPAPAPRQPSARVHSDTCTGRVHDSLGCSCGAADTNRGTET